MADVLKMQDEQAEVPGEDKKSLLSVYACRNSYRSVAVCWVK